MTRDQEADSELAQVTEELARVPPETFTAERNARARTLRQQGRRDLASLVEKLKKPSTVVWTINELARRHPGDMKSLVDAGASLRETQRRMVEGENVGARDLRGAMDAEQAALDSLAGTATALLTMTGRRADEAVLMRLRQTLQSASTADDGIRQRLAAGRLQEELGPTGFDALPARSLAPRRAREAPAEPETEKPVRDERAVREATATLQEAQRVVARAESEARRARHEADALAEQAAAAVARARDAEAELDRARHAAEAAERTVQEALRAAK